MNNDEKMFSLGAFECFATCVINALIAFGKDINYFLINYWNIEYFHNLLLGSKNIRLCSLPFIYSLEVFSKNESIEHVKDYIKENNKVIVQCKASKLDYFPERYLVGESTGMEHTFLINDIDEKGYNIIDGIVNYSGHISYENFLNLSDQDGNIIFYTIKEIKDKKEFTKEEIIKKIITTNSNLYNQNKFDFGQKAYDLFKKKLLNSQKLPKKARDGWISLNKITVTTICNTRRVIWDSFKKLNIFPEDFTEVFEIKINDLIKNWKFVIFYLEKIKVSAKENNYQKLCEKMDDVNQREREILEIMKEFIKTKNKIIA